MSWADQDSGFETRHLLASVRLGCENVGTLLDDLVCNTLNIYRSLMLCIKRIFLYLVGLGVLFYLSLSNKKAANILNKQASHC